MQIEVGCAVETAATNAASERALPMPLPAARPPRLLHLLARSLRVTVVVLLFTSSKGLAKESGTAEDGAAGHRPLSNPSGERHSWPRRAAPAISHTRIANLTSQHQRTTALTFCMFLRYS